MIRMLVREGGTIRSVRVDADRVVLGSGAAAGLRLSGAGIADRHCALRFAATGFEVADLDSPEGTILNGSRVRRAPVAAGDTLTLGSAAVVLEELSGTAPARGAAAAPLFAPPAPRPPESFDVALYRAVRRSPPWILSIGAHAAAGMLFILFTPAAPPPARPVPTLRLASDEAGPLPDEADVSPGDSDLPIPAVRDPGPALLPSLFDDPDLLPSPRRDPTPAAPAPEPDAPIAFGANPTRRVPREGTISVRFDANPAFGGDGAQDANRQAAGLLVKSLGGNGAAERRLLRRLDPRKVLVVKGCYDHVEDVFSVMGLRHDTLETQELEVVPLPADGILVVDCGDQNLAPEAARRVREFVESGGYLVTTDWSLEKVILAAFPGTLRSLYDGGRGVCTLKEHAAIRLPAPSDPLVRGLRAVGEDAVWWIEDRAYPVEVPPGSRARVLVESPDFARKYGSGALAVTFDRGRGRVLHLVGHAWQKEGNLKGAFGMQRLIVNFLLERAKTLGGEPEASTPTPLPAAPDGK